MIDDELKQFLPRKLERPFSDEIEEAKAIKEMFGSLLGQKVLQTLIMDMEYHKDDQPSAPDSFLRWKSGVRYVINHILNALIVEYEEVKDERNID